MAKLSLEEALMIELEKEEKRNKNSKLEEKTLKQIYNELPGVDVHDEPIDTSNVDALLDGVIVVTDPTVTKDEYGEVQERAQEIIENTPEGDMPFDEEYVDSYLITCPICGETFTSPELLHPGDTCPVCLQQPEEFVVKGQLKTTEEVSEMAREQEALDDAKIAANEENEEDEEEPVPGVEEQNEEDLEKQTASKEIPQGNKLQETVNESKSIKTEDTYEEGIFYEIEAALTEAGLNPVRFSESGVMTNNLGWTVTGEDGTEQQITCDGSYLTETENKLEEDLNNINIETMGEFPNVLNEMLDVCEQAIADLEKESNAPVTKDDVVNVYNSLSKSLDVVNNYLSKIHNTLDESIDTEDDFVELTDINE